MTRRIQAYFRTEDEAEGAKTALLSFDADGLDVWTLTDPLKADRRLLLPLVPTNNLAGSGSTFAAFGAAPAAVPVVAADVNEGRAPMKGDDSFGTDDLRADRMYADGDLEGLHYVMEIKVTDEDFNAVVHTLRSKKAFVEIFD
ncbi:hypothetical protein SAMN04487895_109258 [Paenibacillus sophorae]|uniref:Uncharacterized protein n=1 Tax=Paenibacillus sophorae TaxID=1333845 RepID=A0A1H8REF3_9BACL|nr:hypothetical protein [Paenibacillus sophorae]QWU15050.1 hypothetical protein KP014_24610 [Paenibacillus sophorae]SEO64413.1 hypothetical protein SAMN04487895_109258 [Paenibacillus sophorae]